MPRLHYWTMGSNHPATSVEESEFLELPDRTAEFDLFLWVDGAIAVAARRSADGQTRASTAGFRSRKADDLPLRPASARAHVGAESVG